MIKSAKRCLRKAIGKHCLTYDGLLTLVIEVECALNSRPLMWDVTKLGEVVTVDDKSHS